MPPPVEVVRPGVETTIQDWPGRIGLWSVGVPASGPMDELSFRLGNRALGNADGMAGLEVTMGDLALRFRTDAVIMVTGAPTPVMINSVYGYGCRHWPTRWPSRPSPAGWSGWSTSPRGPGRRSCTWTRRRSG